MKLFAKLPFITNNITQHGKQMIMLERVRRKGLFLTNALLEGHGTAFWKTQDYNREIGISFALGAFIFGLGSVLMFCSLQWSGLSNLTNVTFFAGSIPFTVAASLQHFQSANMNVSPDSATKQTLKLIGWNPRSAGWLSTFTQLLGTLAFNVSTFNSIATPDQGTVGVLKIWAPDFEGSVLFLVSGYLAFIEVGNSYWSWNPKNLSWQTVFINLLGCIAFMISAITPLTPDPERAYWVWEYSNTYTLIGALCFFISALLLVKERKSTAPA